MFYKIKKEKLNDFFKELNKSLDIYLPSNETVSSFKLFDENLNYDVDKLKTDKPLKELFFPQIQHLSKFVVENKKIQVLDIEKSNRDFIIFGARECDLKSLEILDRVFLAEPCDVDYKNLRDKSIIVSNACFNPSRTCFCNVFNIDALNPNGDISSFSIDKYLYLKPNTIKGEKIINIVNNLLEICDDNDLKIIENEKQKSREIFKKLPYNNLDIEKFKTIPTEKLFEDEIFEELSKSCLGCGTCTFACPTCQCYDIKDFKNGNKVTRYRCWDSCMYSDFTLMSHGNSRTTQMQRFRQRFLHKLKYFPENNDGIFSCVGCGRCIDKCPSNLHIAKVIKGVK